MTGAGVGPKNGQTSKGGRGGLAQSKISLSASKMLEGGGGVSEFRSFFWEKTQLFFLMPPLTKVRKNLEMEKY